MAGEASQELAKLPPAIKYEGVGIRFVSLLIDSIIINILMGMIGTILGFGMMKLGIISWWWGLIYFLIYIAYFTIMEAHNGQTIGKMITRIKVVREEDGGKIDMERSFKRNILRIIDGLIAYLVGAVLIWRSDKKQRLGDSIAKTLVIKA
ncbi:MAG: RDD family protein [Methanotrichaceae archaeon]|nr:RDD family protein [Methanotrichaceae archaeon]